MGRKNPGGFEGLSQGARQSGVCWQFAFLLYQNSVKVNTPRGRRWNRVPELLMHNYVYNGKKRTK